MFNGRQGWGGWVGGQITLVAVDLMDVRGGVGWVGAGGVKSVGCR